MKWFKKNKYNDWINKDEDDEKLNYPDPPIPGYERQVFSVQMGSSWHTNPLPPPPARPLFRFENTFIGKMPNEYNRGSILEIKYEFGKVNYEELFMITGTSGQETITNLKTGYSYPLRSDIFGVNYCNITNIIVKKET